MLLVVAGLLTAATLVRRPFPRTDGTLSVRGLHAPVTVRRDAHGIPQVYADDPADLFFGQGYVQAQDRFFEMDVRRHLTAGRLSEMFGSQALEADEAVRTMGWRRVAEAEVDRLRPSTQAYLRAFSAGVNAYLRGRSTTRISLEYTVLGLGGLQYEPEPWTPVDSVAWLKAMAWDLRGNMADEIARARLSVSRSPQQVAELYPGYPYSRHDPIMRWTGRTTAAGGTGGDPGSTTGLGLGSSGGIGSNSWVVSGDLTTTGAPLLANDPHLAPSMPGVWYQMGLHCRSVSTSCPFDVSGFTFAGLPGVIIGHNADVAWGFTNLDPDVTDLFLEKVRGGRYLYDGSWRPLQERDEVIRVKGAPSRTITVRSTRHGPLLSDVSPEVSTAGANAEVPPGSPPRGNGYAVALAWTALQPSRTADAIFEIDTATDWPGFRRAAADFAVPSQNLVYADTAGNIGYQAPGRVPIRRNGRSGDYPAAGWLPRNDWSGRFVPFRDLPHELNPPEGFVVTANQAVTGPRYPYHLGDSWDAGYRSQRIRQLLEDRLRQGRRISPAAMAAIQLDTLNPMARVLAPYLMKVLLPSKYYADGQRVLASWDGRQGVDSPGAAYFNAVWDNLLRLTFHDQLKESLWPDGGDRWFRIMTRLLHQPSSPWWDDANTRDEVEDRDTILRRAMIAARDDLTRRVARDPARWSWGALHHLVLDNQTVGHSDLGLVRALFDRGPYPAPGGTSIVDATSWDASADDYTVTNAPSMRMVVDLGDLDASRWVNLTGASGHAFDAHYRDQTRLYLAGRTLPWPASAAAVRRATEDTLVLRPR